MKYSGKLLGLVFGVLGWIPAFGAETAAVTYPGRVGELRQRILDLCLREDRDYVPVFTSLDPMNKASTLTTFVMQGYGQTVNFVDRNARPEDLQGVSKSVVEELRSKASDYAQRKALDPFQRACLAQCIGYQWYKDTSENSTTNGSFDSGEGNCRHSTYLAMYIDSILGIPVSLAANRFSDMASGTGHIFSQVQIEGRTFVMNNNLSSDIYNDRCVFRFSRAWSDHAECRLFSEQDSKYFKVYSKAWNKDYDPDTHELVPVSGSVTSCGSDSVTIENGRVSGVLVRQPPAQSSGSSAAPVSAPGTAPVPGTAK